MCTSTVNGELQMGDTCRTCRHYLPNDDVIPKYLLYYNEGGERERLKSGLAGQCSEHKPIYQLPNEWFKEQLR